MRENDRGKNIATCCRYKQMLPETEAEAEAEAQAKPEPDFASAMGACSFRASFSC